MRQYDGESDESYRRRLAQHMANDVVKYVTITSQRLVVPNRGRQWLSHFCGVHSLMGVNGFPRETFCLDIVSMPPIDVDVSQLEMTIDVRNFARVLGNSSLAFTSTTNWPHGFVETKGYWKDVYSRVRIMNIVRDGNPDASASLQAAGHDQAMRRMIDLSEA